MTDLLLTETDGHVRILTLNRPEARNALSKALRDVLTEAVRSAACDPDIRTIVLTGAGDKAFCAGADLKESPPPDAPASEISAIVASALELFKVVGEADRPVIAALNGAAYGGGLELALACDIRIAAEGVALALPEARVGIGATYGSIVLPQMIPSGIAYEMMFTAKPLHAEEAAHWGLVNKVVPFKDLRDVAIDMAKMIAANAPLTIRRQKAMSRTGRHLALDEALILNVGPDPYQSQDRIEGALAFREKRAPVWTGR